MFTITLDDGEYSVSCPLMPQTSQRAIVAYYYPFEGTQMAKSFQRFWLRFSAVPEL